MGSLASRSGTHRSGPLSGCAGASPWDQRPARRKGAVLVGGVCCILDELVRHRQRRKDTAAEAAWAKGQHTDLANGEKIQHMPAKPTEEKSGNRDSTLECLLAC